MYETLPAALKDDKSHMLILKLNFKNSRILYRLSALTGVSFPPYFLANLSFTKANNPKERALRERPREQPNLQGQHLTWPWGVGIDKKLIWHSLSQILSIVPLHIK